MDHKHLNYFLALAKTLHFARASELCHISAPTLSRNIKQLEDEVGVALFIRDNRSVKLTKEGESFIDYATSTLANWQRFKANVKDPTQHIYGNVSIYCSVTASYSFLHQILEQLRAQHQHIEITLNTGDPALAINRVLDAHESMAIAARPSKLPAQIAFVNIGHSPLVLIGPKIQCPISEKIAKNAPHIDWSELEFIVPEQGFSRQRLEQWWRKNNVHGKIYAQVAGHEAMVSMVSLGLGVAMVPKIVLDNSPLQDKVHVLPSENYQPEGFDIGLAVLKKELNDPAISALWNIAQTLGANVI
ncbi:MULTISPECIES: HTH-type transcriptional activator IlvY [Pseudoalteromonas]|jgi:LysR family positive regulator for ilvC|uniref:HTH-type transcriptional activator IlvY n=1 Tax=Pseudoalteromonas agarivorans TaxID=176102 RepID=A0AAD0TXA3_9GAMM|nr:MULTISPECIES: HTH-type transcriptional activator IlvY [Pseudoalteromonas]MDY6886491.1 HTH-type transcriptional activator IlvY [Pseudomonadota bacterium]AYM86047.1 HTH-type transcriptional activator IlvY [Pseudoalteromonas agarivorans]MCK8106820.1 HTH-type transcriptional activator IlvY [Pseudoalteromonas sp. 2CM41L]MCK8118171.1 HTH-type transcriptional activator IlvY [Pseudoalteromonas sp. 2CM37A]MCK8132441.1 HTH-type transcriptional activator IlvY [Pseudoalteromonas sp. 2CM28B]|tara:strand:- start:10208 stop:11113 length:906 start_codon:yes stop_codon:yes gene_type:complete